MLIGFLEALAMIFYWGGEAMICYPTERGITLCLAAWAETSSSVGLTIIIYAFWE
jgi:hypothetical protein